MIVFLSKSISSDHHGECSKPLFGVSDNLCVLQRWPIIGICESNVYDR